MPDKNAKKRVPLRKRQAMGTRRAIVAAALERFRERGCLATTIEAIAEEAGVAVSTVYYAFGSKLEILRAIREEWHRQSTVRTAR